VCRRGDDRPRNPARDLNPRDREIAVFVDHLREGHAEKLPFGAAVELPDPVGITLDTEPLKDLAD
jgi:hypothetical protein